MSKRYVVLSVLLVIGMVFAACGKATPTATSQATVASSLTTTSSTTTSSPRPTTAPATSTSAKPATPKLLTWATLDIGSTTYADTGFVAEAVRTKSGVPVRILPIGNDIGRVTVVRSKSAELLVSGASAYQSREGTMDFANRAWGPQKMRMLYQLAGGTVGGPIARGDSKIFTVKDLKGKKIPFVVGMQSHNSEIEAILAFGSLTWTDVVKVELPSYGAASDALADGKTDMYFGSTSSAATVKLASGSGGIRFIPLPRADKEGWQRLNAISPGDLPSVSNIGPGLSATVTYEGLTSAQAMDAYDFLDDDMAYFTTKAWADAYPLYKDKGGRLESGSMERVLDIVGVLRFAFHPGSIRFFKEVGKWSPALEAWNNKILDRESKLLKAWDACLADADRQGLTQDKLAALWDKYRSEILPVQ